MFKWVSSQQNERRMTVEEVAKVVMNYDSSDGENTESFSDESCRSEDFEPQGGKCAYL